MTSHARISTRNTHATMVPANTPMAARMIALAQLVEVLPDGHLDLVSRGPPARPRAWAGRRRSCCLAACVERVAGQGRRGKRALVDHGGVGQGAVESAPSRGYSRSRSRVTDRRRSGRGRRRRSDGSSREAPRQGRGGSVVSAVAGGGMTAAGRGVSSPSAWPWSTARGQLAARQAPDLGDVAVDPFGAQDLVDAALLAHLARPGAAGAPPSARPCAGTSAAPSGRGPPRPR